MLKICRLLLFFAVASASADDFAIQDSHQTAFKVSLNLLDKKHFQSHNLKELQSDVFKDYLQALDPYHLYFLQSDIDEFKSNQQQIFNNQNLGLAFEIHKKYRERMRKLNEWSLKRLEKPFNLETNQEYLLPDLRDKKIKKNRPYFENFAEASAYQEKRLTDQIIRLMLNGKSESEARERLSKRYKSLLKSVEQLTAQDVFDIYMNSLSSRFDPHTSYFSPRGTEDFDINMRLSLEGIGAVLSNKDEKIIVRELISGGPAAKSALIKVKDQILGVGQGKHGEIVDIVGWRLDKAVDLIRGKKGSSVRLLIERDGEMKEITLVRDEIKLEEQAAFYTIEEVNGQKIGLIDLPSFYMDFEGASAGKKDYRSTSRDVEKILQEMKKEQVDGVILDLRNNGGGSLIEAIATVGLFIDKGPVVIVNDNKNSDVKEDLDAGSAYSGPLVVLINEHSASASEIFAAAIQDYQRGLIVGNNSFGKGTVQTLLNLNRLVKNSKNLGSLKFTTAMFHRVNGGSTQLKGVQPDITLPSSENIKEVGEISLDYALNWSEIKGTEIAKNNHINPDLILNLRQSHQNRMNDNFAMMLHQKEALKIAEINERNNWSLNFAQRKTEYDNRKKEVKDYEEKLRSLIPPLKRDEKIQKKLAESNLFIDDDEEKQDFVPDMILFESLWIAADYFDLYKRF